MRRSGWPSSQASEHSRTAGFAVVLGVATTLGLAACGEPTAQLVQPTDTRFTYEIPIDFADIAIPDQSGERLQFAPPGTEVTENPSEPLLSFTTLTVGDQASYQALRLLATAGQFDPIDEDDEAAPESLQLIGYLEISEPQAWGIRMQFALGMSVSDYQALVDRETNQIAISEMFCTQACFVEQQALIDQIQRSWSLE